jgi:hypothetical protein
MLHQFSSKFELQQSELEMVKEYLSTGEAAMIDQARKSIPLGPLADVEPISDNEEEGNQEEVESEDEVEDEEVDEVPLAHATSQSQQAQQKRPRSRTSEPLDDEDSGLPLPEMQHMPCEGSRMATQGRSGRIRKRPKMPDGFEIDTL